MRILQYLSGAAPGRQRAGAARRRWPGLARACLAVGALALPTSWAAAQQPAPGLGARLVQGYISPAMNEFERAAVQLRDDLAGWCRDDAARPAPFLRQGYARLVAAWSGIEFLRFGPLVQGNRFERIHFWPDPRGITVRQAQALLADPAGVPDARALSTHSVAVQGLPALEYVLYRDGGLLDGGRGAQRQASCGYAVALAQNLAALGGELAAAWAVGGSYARLFSSPSADNALYRNEREVAGEAVKALSTGLQFLREAKLQPALGAEARRANPRRAPFWRSGASIPAMSASAGGMLRFYQAGGYVFERAQWIDENIRGELRRAQEGLDQLPPDLGRGLADEQGYRQLGLVSLLLGNARRLIDEDMASALGVRIGFNALDGD